MRGFETTLRVRCVHGVALLECRDIGILIQRAVRTSSNSDPTMLSIAIPREHHPERSPLSTLSLLYNRAQRAVRLLAATADELVVGRGYG